MRETSDTILAAVLLRPISLLLQYRNTGKTGDMHAFACQLEIFLLDAQMHANYSRISTIIATRLKPDSKEEIFYSIIHAAKINQLNVKSL